MFFKSAKEKKEAVEIVANAEYIAAMTGLNVTDILNKYTGNNDLIKKIKQELSQGRKRSKVYIKLFDKIFIDILRLAEDKSQPVGNLFRDYVEIMLLLEKGAKKIKGSISYAVGSYILNSVLVYFLLLKLRSELEKVGAKNMFLLSNINYIYVPVVVVVLALVLLALVKYPRKTPLVRNIFKELDSLQYLSAINITLKSGLSMLDIYESLKKNTGWDESRRKGADWVLDFLLKNNYIKQYEVYSLQAALQTYRTEQVFSVLLEKRKLDFDDNISTITSILSNVSILLLVVPLAFVFVSLGEMYLVINQMAGSLK